ncbi:hypothetical protein ACHQM5_028181 [Ranunculus cassubicifolius]
MNTNIIASVKPEYPVVDRNPPFTKTVANFNTLDYLRFTTITGIAVTVGYLSDIKPNINDGPEALLLDRLTQKMEGWKEKYMSQAGRKALVNSVT